MHKRVIAIIPARMSSSRLPGKPLIKIKNKPLIQYVYENVSESKDLDKIIVATCDKEIFSLITSIGGTAVMTSKKHERASDRCAEALLKYEKQSRIKFDIVLMVQGDEPMTNAKMIKQSLEPFYLDSKIKVVNLMSTIKSKKDIDDPNCIKVVVDNNFNALFFSRNPIPSNTRNSKSRFYKQVCVIPFERNFLLKYLKLKPTKLEISESIDMLRILENGYKVKMVETNQISYPIDVLSDIKRVNKYL